MDDNRSIFKYIGQLFATYGVIVLIFVLFALVIGEQTKEDYSLYSLGNAGLSIPTLLQLFLLTIIITASQRIFLTDLIIKSMSLAIRTLLFFITICLVMVLFVFLFKWFPANNFFSWLGFLVSFTICTSLSILYTKLKEKAENKKMESALKKFSEE